MQARNASQRTFLHRTDTLAARLGVHVQDLTGVIGISRRTLFAGRSNPECVSAKTLARLEAAERAAGITTEPPTAGGHSATPAPTPGRAPAALTPPTAQDLHSLAHLVARLDAIEALLHDLLARLDDRTP